MQKLIEHHIPITKSMGFKVYKIENFTAELSAPLQPNHNHKNTVFGGSLYAACAAACYAVLYNLQIEEKLDSFDLLLATGNSRYLKPVTEDFKVRATINTSEWSILLSKLVKKGAGKITVNATVFTDSDPTILCEFQGVFVLKKVS
jgi:thioesterase domain-containing protein